MKYIKKITLENFQSHKYSQIELDQGMNVIVGQSDSGKSAIIRGIKWVLYNEPSGDFFIREGEKECSVSLEFSDSTILKRYRSKSKNQYILTKNNGEELTFEGFGSTIPEEIIDTIGIKKIYLDSNESNSINIGEQLEGAFLLSEKTSTRASAIGRLVGVNIIDEALVEVLKDIRALNITKKGLDELILNLSKEIEEYDYLKDLKLKLNKVKLINSQLNKSNLKLQNLEKAKDKLLQIEFEKDGLIKISKRLQVIDTLNDTIQGIDAKIGRFRYFNTHYNNLLLINKDKKVNYNIVLSLKSLNEAVEKANSIERNNNNHRLLLVLQNKFKTTKHEIKTLSVTIELLSGLNLANEGFKKLLILIEHYKKVERVRSLYLQNQNSLFSGRSYIEKLSGIERAESLYSDIDIKLKLLTKLVATYKNINALNTEINKEEKNIVLIKESIEVELEKYKNVLKDIEVCPYCLSDIDESRINHIINHHIGG